MAILNSEIEFTSVAAEVQQAFSGRRARKRLFRAGYQLYKFTEYPLIGRRGRVSPWWSSVKPLDAGDAGLDESVKRAERLGVTPAQFARARSAVTKQWNSMQNLLVAHLRTPVYGFVGGVSHQPIDEGAAYKNVVFIGGAKQIWLPNLTAAHVRKV